MPFVRGFASPVCLDDLISLASSFNFNLEYLNFTCCPGKIQLPMNGIQKKCIELVMFPCYSNGLETLIAFRGLFHRG